MGKFDRFIICSDYDGTITKNDLKVEVSPENWIERVCEKSIEAMKYFTENGGRFILSSGRSPYSMNFWDKLPIDDLFSGVNGTALYSKSQDKLVFTHIMKISPYELINRIVENVEGVEEYHITGLDLETVMWSCESGIDALSFAKAYQKPVLKIIFYVRNDFELMDRLIKAGEMYLKNDCEMTRSCDNLLEFNDKSSGKGEIVRYLKNTTKDKIIIALGDYYNDYSMLKEADYSYCPENAMPEIKAIATKVFCQAKDGFVWDVVEEIEKNLL